jgi:L-threonylcarbamoyladenylate synthase
MITRVSTIDPAAPDSAIIADAAAVIRAGGLVAFPTETVYGLGANAYDADAVDRIFAAKARPATDPIIVHLADRADLTQIAVEIPDLAHRLAAAFFPGALTLVLRRHPRVPANVSAAMDTVAVRMPAHPIAHALIAASCVPIAAPSANRFSRPSATTAAHVLADLDGRIDLILDGGAATIGVESTILDLTADPPVVLRPGGVSLEALRAFAPDLTIKRQYLDADHAASAPGQLLKHYAPRAELHLYSGDHPARVVAALNAALREHTAAGRHVGVLAADEDRIDMGVVIVRLGSAANLEQIAAALFARLRELDAAGVDLILARDFGGTGLALAIRDRLTRAANGKVTPIP